MRPKSLMLLALALGCGLVASIGISQVMDRPAQVTMEMAPIYIAKHNINLGDPIDADMIGLQEWPKDKIPRGAISELSELEGRRPRTAIIEGEPILEGKLLAPGQVADPIQQIPKGMRLKTIAVNAEKGVGLLGPGDRVDVQLFVRKDARTGIETAKSKIILQNIRVFAVDQTVQRSPDGSEEKAIAKTVSLMLSPEQASKLSLAEQIGELSLIPRNPDDDAVASWAETKIEDLLGDGESGSREKEQGIDEVAEKEEPAEQGNLLDAVAAAAPPAVPPFRMEIVEAQAVREMLFDGETGKPIRQLVEAPITSGPSVTPSLSPTATSAGSSLVAPGDADKMLDNFPIDLRTKN
jgi:pilus assembly protein CpaB